MGVPPFPRVKTGAGAVPIADGPALRQLPAGGWHGRRAGPPPPGPRPDLGGPGIKWPGPCPPRAVPPGCRTAAPQRCWGLAPATASTRALWPARQAHVGPVEPLGLESLRESNEDHCRGSSSRRLDRLVQQLSGGIPVLAAPGDEGDLRAGVGGLRQPPRIDAAAAGALVPHVPGHMADEHHGRLLVQGQQVPVVLQQHGALRRRPAGQGVVDLHVRRRSGPAGLHRPVHQRQDPAGAPVQVGAVQGPGLRRPAAGPRHIAGAAGHHQVAPRPKGGDPVRDAAPVGDHRAVKAPLLPENVRQELPVLSAVDAVDLVVGAHHGGRAALPDHDLKGGEIELPQGPLIQHAVGGEALVLLAVAGEMLHAGPRPGGLEPPDPGGPPASPPEAGPRRSTQNCGRTGGRA